MKYSLYMSPRFKNTEPPNFKGPNYTFYTLESFFLYYYLLGKKKPQN